jgi:type I restriction enzyme, S subunit
VTGGWQTKKLGSVCDIALGRTPSRADESLWDENRQSSNVWLSIADLLGGQDSVVSDSSEYLSDKGAAASKIVREGTLLASFKLTLGRLAFAGRDLYTNEAIAALTIFDDRELSKEFLFYYLHFFDWDEACRGDVKLKGKTLNKAKLKELEIHIPPPPEQQRIVGILDQAFEGIGTAKANAEKNLRNTLAVFDSHLNSVFIHGGSEWVETTIGEQIKFIDYRGRTPEKTAGGLRLITAKNVKMGWLQETPREFVAPESYDSWMTRGIPRLGDVLLTTEAPLANVAQLDTDEQVVFAQRIIIMQPDATKLDSTFLKYLLLSQPTQQRIHAKGTGATVKGIKASLLKTVEISFPKSLAAQRTIVERFDMLRKETQRLASVYTRKLAALDELKKSLLHQAFSGEF